MKVQPSIGHTVKTGVPFCSHAPLVDNLHEDINISWIDLNVILFRS